MIELYFMALSIAAFAIGIGGIVASRHFLITALAIEAALLASTMLAVVMFYYSAAGDIVSLLLALWSVAAAETMALMVFYRYMAKWKVGMDVTKLSKLRH
jgi:NADH:ubiquinone oxidoreductase subunit K